MKHQDLAGLVTYVSNALHAQLDYTKCIAWITNTPGVQL